MCIRDSRETNAASAMLSRRNISTTLAVEWAHAALQKQVGALAA